MHLNVDRKSWAGLRMNGAKLPIQTRYLVKKSTTEKISRINEMIPGSIMPGYVFKVHKYIHYATWCQSWSMFWLQLTELTHQPGRCSVSLIILTSLPHFLWEAQLLVCTSGNLMCKGGERDPLHGHWLGDIMQSLLASLPRLPKLYIFRIPQCSL